MIDLIIRRKEIKTHVESTSNTKNFKKFRKVYMTGTIATVFLIGMQFEFIHVAQLFEVTVFYLFLQSYYPGRDRVGLPTIIGGNDLLRYTAGSDSGLGDWILEARKVSLFMITPALNT